MIIYIKRNKSKEKMKENTYNYFEKFNNFRYMYIMYKIQ